MGPEGPGENENRGSLVREDFDETNMRGMGNEGASLESQYCTFDLLHRGRLSYFTGKHIDTSLILVFPYVFFSIILMKELTICELVLC